MMSTKKEEFLTLLQSCFLLKRWSIGYDRASIRMNYPRKVDPDLTKFLNCMIHQQIMQ